jgi:purine-binding chemotaxis protein CheW
MEESALGGAVGPMEDDDGSTENQYLTFCVAGQKFGVAVANVVQIVKMQPLTPVPGYPDYAKGIIEVREQAVPVLDLRLRFHKQAREYDTRTCIVVTKIDEAPFGLVADSVDSVVCIDPDQIAPAPKPLAGQEENAFLIGVARLEKELILMMDTEKVISLDTAKIILKKIPKQKKKA